LHDSVQIGKIVSGRTRGDGKGKGTVKLAWKQVKILGFTFTLPLIVVIAQKLDAERVEMFRQYRAEMAECPHCHKFHIGHYHLSLIEHLVDDHSMDSMHVMDIVDDLGRKKLQHTKKKRELQNVAN
jgi:hypothetical protein